MPDIHEDQIFGVIDPENTQYGADVNESYIWGVSGVRGSGKSETLDFLGVRALAMGLPVWSNFPIKFRLLQHHKQPMTLEAMPLIFQDLFSISSDLYGGLIIIDEYQDWDNALSFMTTQSKLLHAFWAQIRKNQLSFAYGSKKLRWIGLKTREETDIEIGCQDAAKTPKGRRLYKRGERIYWDYKDWSGNWTGKAYEDDPITYPYTFEAKFLWGSYDTNQRFDIFEAMRGLKLDLDKTVISDKDQNAKIDLEATERMIESLFSKEERIKASEIYDLVGANGSKEKTAVSRLIKDMGGKEVIWAGCKYFKYLPGAQV
jgi:hypothetical protein